MNKQCIIVLCVPHLLSSVHEMDCLREETVPVSQSHFGKFYSCFLFSKSQEQLWKHTHSKCIYIYLYLLLCSKKKKWSHTGFEQHEGENDDRIVIETMVTNKRILILLIKLSLLIQRDYESHENKKQTGAWLRFLSLIMLFQNNPKYNYICD